MGKQNKPLTPEQRVAKLLDNQAQFEGVLQLLLPAQVWPYVDTLVRHHLATGGQPARELVALMALTLRQEALRRFGHDTLETFALAKLLRDGTGGWQPKPPRLDAITHINAAKHPPHRLSAEQDSAAGGIIQVWQAFGKFLEIGGRGIGGGGSSRASALSPMDVMGQDLWDHHRNVFTPWQAKASRVVVERRTSTGTHLTIAAVVFKVLVEDVYPEELDTAYALIKGTALKALKAGLDAYSDPDRLDKWGKRPPDPANAAQQGGPQAQTAAGPADTTPTDADAAPAPAKSAGLWVTPRPVLAPGTKVKLGPRKKKDAVGD